MASQQNITVETSVSQNPLCSRCHYIMAIAMEARDVLILLLAGIVSVVLAIVFIRYSKKRIARSMSRHFLLRMLKTRSMNGKELANSARGARSNAVQPELIPVLLVKLEQEGLIQRAGSENRYVITTRGLQSLLDMDSYVHEVQRVSRAVELTSRIAKFMISHAVDRISMIGMYDSTENENQIIRGKEKSKVELEPVITP